MRALRWTSLWILTLATACATGTGMRAPQSAPASKVAAATQGFEAAPSRVSPNAQVESTTAEAGNATGAANDDSPPSAQPPPNDAVVATAGVTAPTQSKSNASDASATAQPMMDIEARLAIEVKDVAESLSEVRALVSASGGQILEESLEDAKRERPTARLTARIPSAGAYDFLARLEATGVVRSRQMNSRDVGKEYFDANLRVKSLEQVLRRYYELLSKANSLDETLRVEEHITRLSAEIESIKGELRWLRDRVARATIRLELYAKGGWIEPVVTPEAKLYPGLRAVSVWDWRGDAGSRYGIGAGLSLRFSRYFSIDFDGVQSTRSMGGGFETSLLTLGGEFYSDFLGAGRRRWFNPYLGLRAGYGRIERNNQALVGGAIGLEIFKCDLAVLNLDLRAFGAFGSELGSHLVLQPALGIHFAF